MIWDNEENNLEVVAEKPSSPRITPVLFIHGMCHGAWCWQEHFLPYFARHNYASYALNLRGHGKSESRKPLRSLSLSDYVQDVVRAVDLLEATPVIIGHSMGGMVVQKYLETRRTPAAVLLASVPPEGVLSGTIRFALRRPGAILRVLLNRSLYPLVETPELCRKLVFSDNISDLKAERYWSMMQDESYRAFWDMLFFDLPQPRRMTTPTLILGAENDALISIHENNNSARAYGTEAEIFPGMAHDMMLETGWQQVADRILEWLEENKL